MTIATLPIGRAAPARRSRRRTTGGARLLVVLAALIAAALLIPLAFLLVQATEVGWSQVSSLLWRHFTVSLLWNTVRLTLAVTVLSAILAVGLAWCIERTDLPLRGLFGVLAVLPLAIPDFVVGYGWISIAPAVHGFYGATLVMTLGTYPLVYLPVAAALRRIDPALEEIAQSAGLGRAQIFFRVTLPEIRLALLGGSLLLALALLAEYGAFEILGYQTFTTEIFTEFRVGFDLPAASALSLVLVVLGLGLILGEMGAQGRGRSDRVSRQAARPARRATLGRAKLPVVFSLIAIAGLTIGVPLGTLIFWLTSTQATTLPAGSLLAAAGHSALYSALAALVSTAAAFPVAYLVVRRRNAVSVVLERSTYLVQGLPGLAVALALAFFTIRFAPAIYQSSELLVAAYAVLFFPLALVCVRSSLAHAAPVFEDVARSLGCRPFTAHLRVTLPLIAPGLAAAFALVFLSAMTELTATLVLVPTGVQTLATQFWAYTSDLAYSAAAPYAAMIVLISAVPGYLLTRWFAQRTSSVAIPLQGASVSA